MTPSPFNQSNSCRACKFWVGQQNLQDIRLHNAVGECRRNPPVGFPQQTPQGIASLTVVPVTNRDFWCGEFALGLLEN